MIKLIVSDMDGTLLNEQMEISDANASAIKRAQNEGIHFAIATGRDFPSASPIVNKHGIVCPLILSNGAEFFNTDGDKLYNRGLEKNMVRNILSILSTEDTLHTELVTTNGLYTVDKSGRINMVASLLTDINPDITFEEARELAHEKITDINLHQVDSFDAVLEDDRVIILKVTTHSMKGKEVLTPIKVELNNTIPHLAVTASSTSNLEINHEKATKGIAVAQLAKTLGLKADEVMTIGDNINDVSMLEWADYSVAMENAAPEAKAAANYSTSSNAHNGVAEVISRVLSGSMDKKAANF
ncbi:Cof-type HAD-IIB family hydrolase [Alkalibacterium sp. MB6]|uniref:Cof-type HAD-IIB family hydrolase n=1 Tax=Alkalibacterium sp. MB6 TaxID=2081965 RepID=UPI00137B2BBD|nr:Cof-type HAD-IIB family hydrolase [Alkalibacterium sp. MB6]